MSTGLLILCSPLSHLHHRIGCLVTAAVQHIGKTLYVQLEPGQSQLWPRTYPESPENTEFLSSCGKFIANFYKKSFHVSQSLDVRFLLNGIKYPDTKNIHLNNTLDVVLTDAQPTALVEKYLSWRFKNYKIGTEIIHINTNDGEVTTSNQAKGLERVSSMCEWKVFDNLVLGGTFDRLHNGHKMLLSDAILRCRNQLTIGVTERSMIKGKKLWELIEPTDMRISALRHFLTDVDATLTYKIEAITDPFGPSIEDPQLQCIVVSEETLKGGKKVNEERQKKGMNTLDIHVTGLMSDDERNPNEELKISSSSLRMRSLGTRRNMPIEKLQLAKHPYVIGLTGGIASGKSSIAKRLSGLGAAIVDCDRLGHLSYSIGMPSYHKIIENFGSGIVDSDGTINRKLLGKEVFGSKVKLDTLNRIVWPEIRRLAKEEIQQFAKAGIKIVVMEAAVLLEAGWDDEVHEVWVSIIPEDEAVRRIQDRNGINETHARQRINNQMANVEKIAHATVVFCTLWEPNYTQKQVEKAWEGLNEFLQLNKTQHMHGFKL